MENLHELNLISITIRVILSLLLGGIIGIERSRKNRPAGFRTYMLVCLSSTLVMMTNQYIYQQYGGTDPARLGAQVISGIGFLGAGTIIVTQRSQVRGLTTAAGLWSSACLGLAIGIGFYEGAVIVAAVIILIMTIFIKIDHYLASNNKNITIYVSFMSIENFDNFIEHCKKLDIKVNDIEITKPTKSDEIGILTILSLKLNKPSSHVMVIQTLSECEGLIHIEELF